MYEWEQWSDSTGVFGLPGYERTLRIFAPSYDERHIVAVGALSWLALRFPCMHVTLKRDFIEIPSASDSDM